MLLMVCIPILAGSVTINDTTVPPNADITIAPGSTYLIGDCDNNTWDDPIHIDTFTLQVDQTGSYSLSATATSGTDYRVMPTLTEGAYTQEDCISSVGSSGTNATITDTWTLDAGRLYGFYIVSDNRLGNTGAPYSFTITGPGTPCLDCPAPDMDSDGVEDFFDNCPTTSNANQADADTDGTGDVCDLTPSGDDDSDGVDNAADNCPTIPNADQADSDNDNIGDACDLTPSGDDDTDGIDNATDNCPLVANPGQIDSDGDGTGDACDPTPSGDEDGDGVENARDHCPARGDEGYGVGPNGCPPRVWVRPDDRINWHHGDLSTVVYSHGEGAVVYWYVNGNTWLGLHITPDDVANADANQPQNIPVLEYDQDGCRAAFYILRESNEYQINYWTYEGKLYELISTTLDFANPTMRYFDPNE